MTTTFGQIEIGATFHIQGGVATYRKATPLVALLIAANGDHRALPQTGLSDDHAVTTAHPLEGNTVDICTIHEYGLTQRLQTPIRCF